MNNKLTIQDFINQKIAIVFDNPPEHVLEFLKMCRAEGVKWCSGTPADKFIPEWYDLEEGGHMAMSIDKGFLEYDVDFYYESCGYKLVSASAFFCKRKEEMNAPKKTIQDFIYKKISVTFDSVKQEKKFLKLCAAKGFKWLEGEPADKFVPTMYGFAEDGESIAFNKCKQALTHQCRSYHESHGFEIVPASEFFAADEKPAAKYKVTIECVDGKTTTAKLLVNGSEVKQAKSLCSPDDKFNLATGAKLAVDRLFRKK